MPKFVRECPPRGGAGNERTRRILGVRRTPVHRTEGPFHEIDHHLTRRNSFALVEKPYLIGSEILRITLPDGNHVELRHIKRGLGADLHANAGLRVDAIRRVDHLGYRIV
ncbi:MAG TPA: hypothetical protein VF092_30175 [Longimicrobium sp.]